MRLRSLCCAAAIAAGLGTAGAATPPSPSLPSLPWAGDAQHVGAATCAGASCHGAPRPAANSRIQQNEFFTWERDDAHSNAYRLLGSERGKKIAAALKLGPATAAERCLGCHTDAVPAARQGRRYRAAEGVSCEACHGGAEAWLATHSAAGRSHADNVAAGLYPLSEPGARARVCLHCHLGSAEHPVDHALMAAGHPPLSFELDTFTAIEPAHFRTDAAHAQWKPEGSGSATWAAGQRVAAGFVLDNLGAEGFGAPGPGSGVFPELASYDCNACHHSPAAPRWSPQLGGTPGRAQLACTALEMVGDALAVLMPAAREGWRAELEALQSAGTAAEVRAHAGKLKELLAGFDFGTRPLDAAAALKLFNRVAEHGRERAGDLTFAEQAAMALGALANQVVQERKAGGPQLKPALDAVFAAVKRRDAYDPARFRAAVMRLDEEAARVFGNKS